MKKRTVLILLSVFMLCLFTGCQGRDTEFKYNEDLDKAQKIEIIDASSNQVKSAITKKEDIEKFVNDLNIDSWSIKVDLPEGLKEKEIYRYYMEPTTKAGEEDMHNALEKVLDLITYEDDNYITIKIEDINISFKKK